MIMREWEETGLGNRLQTIVSGLLFAIITDRALLVDWPDEETTNHWNKEEVVAMKALHNFFIDPDVDWDYAKHKAHIEELITQGIYTDTDVYYGSITQPNVTYKGYRGNEAPFQCDDYNIYFDEDIVSFRADNYFGVNIVVHPLYR